MRICFFYRLRGGKTSYEYIKSFIRYLKTIHSKVIYFSRFFPKAGFAISEKTVEAQASDLRLSTPNVLDNSSPALAFQAIANFLLNSS